MKQFAPHIFRCRICRKYANYGFGVHLLEGIEGEWYCWDHIPTHLAGNSPNRGVKIPEPLTPAEQGLLL